MTDLIKEIQEAARIKGFEAGTKYGYELGYADAEEKYQNMIEALLIEQFKL